jgi:diguanylate cyclase (GGDEF)-like protein
MFVGIAVVSCIVGSVSAMAGGPPLALLAAALVGLAAFACFRFVGERQDEPVVSPVVASAVPAAPVIADIPPDRVDPLTGLANENGLMAWFAEKAERIRADGKGIIVLVADLADFERLEQSRGKKTADAILVEVAGRVATCTGTDGIAARTGGDEFAAIATIVPEKSEEIAAEQAGKLADLIQRPVELPSGVVWIGGSVGASYGAVSDGPAVLEEARKALSRAKVLGLGHYVVYKPDTPE